MLRQLPDSSKLLSPLEFRAIPLLLETVSSGFIAPRNASGCSVIVEPGVMRTFSTRLEVFLYLSSLDEESELDSDLSSPSHFFGKNQFNLAKG